MRSQASHLGLTAIFLSFLSRPSGALAVPVGNKISRRDISQPLLTIIYIVVGVCILVGFLAYLWFCLKGVRNMGYRMVKGYSPPTKAELESCWRIYGPKMMIRREGRIAVEQVPKPGSKKEKELLFAQHHEVMRRKGRYYGGGGDNNAGGGDSGGGGGGGDGGGSGGDGGGGDGGDGGG